MNKYILCAVARVRVCVCVLVSERQLNLICIDKYSIMNLFLF